MEPTAEQRQMAKALCAEFKAASESCQVFDEHEREWVRSGTEHMDHKNWPILGSFAALLRKVVLGICLIVLGVLVVTGMTDAIKSYWHKASAPMDHYPEDH